MSSSLFPLSSLSSPFFPIFLIHPEARLCTGCLRTMDEIRDWSSYSDSERADIMATLPDRSAQIAKRRGGRAARLKRP